MQRYFISQPLEKRMIIQDKGTIHHIKNVMRNKKNDKIVLVYEKKAYIYIIDSISDNIFCDLMCKEGKNPELVNNVDFAIAFLKKDNFELSIQKLCENGVSNIIPILFNRSVVKIDSKKWNKKKARYQEIIKSACMQSQRNMIAQINDPLTLENIAFDNYDLILVCYELETTKLISDYNYEIGNAENILVIIGPEGGIEKEEIESINNNNVRIISLGSRILRAETAVISAMYYISVVIEGVK